MAVVAVIAYHLGFSWAKGGFLGVDLFFVLSGYLITSLLLAEWRTTGTIDFALFWTRRARRLLPASLLMIAVVAVVMPQMNGLPTAGDALASVAYYANWHFISGARSYFADLAQASPFRHMWSLAIEEQFYLLWPVLFAWTSRARIGQTRALTALVCAGTFISVALMAVLHSPADPPVPTTGPTPGSTSSCWESDSPFSWSPTDRPRYAFVSSWPLSAFPRWPPVRRGHDQPATCASGRLRPPLSDSFRMGSPSTTPPP